MANVKGHNEWVHAHPTHTTSIGQSTAPESQGQIETTKLLNIMHMHCTQATRKSEIKSHRLLM